MCIYIYSYTSLDVAIKEIHSLLQVYIYMCI